MPIIHDKLKRPLRDLRISVTDRCNFRCTYCMPAEIFGPNYLFLKKRQILTYEEITEVAKAFASLGVKKLRLTGGEPLVRKNLYALVEMLCQIEGIEDIALTTNGSLLPKEAKRLKQAGLKRVTVSLDSLDNEKFGKINGRGVGADAVLRGIAAAEEAGMAIKINMVVIKGINDDEIVSMARHFQGTGHILRYIEFMDVGNTNGWNLKDVVTKKEILERLNKELPVEPIGANYYGEVASRFRIQGTEDELGIIASVSEPFCASCTRARLSADGKLYTCLFASHGTNLRDPLGAGEDIAPLIKKVWIGRTDRYSEERSSGTPTTSHTHNKIEMSYIGG